MKVKARRAPKALPQSYARCVDIGAALERTYCPLSTVEDVVAQKTPRYDPFPWKTLSVALQGLQDLKDKAPGLSGKITKVSKDTAILRALIYRTPGARRRIQQQFFTVHRGLRELNLEARSLCADPPQAEIT